MRIYKYVFEKTFSEKKSEKKSEKSNMLKRPKMRFLNFRYIPPGCGVGSEKIGFFCFFHKIFGFLPLCCSPPQAEIFCLFRLSNTFFLMKIIILSPKSPKHSPPAASPMESARGECRHCFVPHQRSLFQM